MSTLSGTFSGGMGKRNNSASKWLLLMVLALLVVGVDIGAAVWQGHHLADARTKVADLRVLAQRFPVQGQEISYGKITAFPELARLRNTVDDTLAALQTRYGEQEAVANELIGLAQAWEPLASSTERILASEPAMQLTRDTVEKITTALPGLQTRLNRALPSIIREGINPVQLEGTLQLSTVLGSMVGHANDIRAGTAQVSVAGTALVGDAARFQQMLEALTDGDSALDIEAMRGQAAQGALAQLAAEWWAIKADVDTLAVQLDVLATTLTAVEQLSASTGDLLENGRRAFEALSQMSAFGGPKDARLFPNFWLAVIFMVMAVVFLVLFVRNLLHSRSHEQSLRFKAQEQAIMRLLEEIVALSEGDLTVQATVTEDMTGAIADAVNYTIEELRDLVTKIRNVSNQVARAAQESQITSMELAQAAVQQTDQITSASDRIGEMALSIEQVSHNSNESAEVAQRSVLIAAEGADVVRQTIQGMDQIRDQIQETSKRIKRLGESSQEIGSIIELINSISEQTNILALNAAVQAASAGEAGRGFAVVADEVQRLAERTSNATRRIEGLVQAIQADTSETINSMEQTTAEVVSGAHLAEDAGTALTEIERVSNDLNNLISNISVAAQQQAAAASNITRSMGSIRKIAGQTARGAGQTAESLGHLNQMAATMMRLVAGFKLPASETVQ